MKQVMYYIFALVALFLVIVYYKGFTSDVSTSGSAIGKIILFLQGRDSNGHITSYPS